MVILKWKVRKIKAQLFYFISQKVCVVMIKPFGFGKWLHHLEALKIASERCLKNKSPLTRCNLCANVCPKKGFSFQNGQWEVSDCSLCGRCVSLCPCEVFSIDEKKLLELMPSKHLILTCQNDKQTSYGMKLFCFKALRPELIFYLLKKHEKVSLVVSEATCASCENEFSPEVLKRLLERYGLSYERLSFISDDEAVKHFHQRLESSRRAYLTGSYKALLNQGADLALEEMNDLALSEKESLPLSRSLLYHAYQDERGEGSLPYPLLFVTRCHFCGACEKLCPEEALKIIEDEGKKYLIFQPVLCNFCKLCEEVCMAKGIHWGEYVTREDFFEARWQKVAEAKEASCVRCQRKHHSFEASEVCYFCAQKK